jgi:anti-sigma regulatory factor (Ser/Thr protein kinase)
MAKLGSTQVAFNLAIAFRSFALNILLMKSGGTDAVAVMTVLNMVSCFIGMIPTGIAGTVLMLGSIFNGEKNRRAIEELYVYAMKIAMIMSAVAILLTIIFAPQLAAVFYSSGTLTWSLTIPMLRIFIWFVVFSSVNSIIQKIHQSQGEVLLSNVLSITENLIIVAGAFVLSAAMGTNGVWLAYPVGNIINLGIMFLMIWIGIKRRPGTIADLISVGSRNEVPAENTYTREIPSMEDVVKTSEEIMQFCRERGLGQETCYMSALSVEEMAGNIIRYGFVNKRKHSINVYMIVDNGALTLRVRDDCMMFDPVQYMEQFNQTDKTRNMGIKLVADTAKEMKYQRLIGFNYLTISF